MEKAPFVILILQRPVFSVLYIQTYVDNVDFYLFRGHMKHWQRSHRCQWSG